MNNDETEQSYCEADSTNEVTIDGTDNWRSFVAIGVMFFLMLVGIGGCGYLWDLGDAVKAQSAHVSVHDNTVLNVK